MRMGLIAGVLALSVLPAAAQTSCGSFDFAGPFAEAYFAGQPYREAARATEVISTLPDGACHQDRLLAALAEKLGPVVGYKAAATSPGAQKQLGLDQPVLGVLFRDQIRADGSEIAITEGARMIFELDLLARVKSDAINAATTPEEALSEIDALIPFIELGDLMVPKGVEVTGPLLQAMNAGSRLGVEGAPIPVDGMGVDDFAAIRGRLAKDGTAVAEADGSSLLGNPMNAVLWIAKAANARGMKLKAGDVLSLGSMGRFQIAAPGIIVATYGGLGDDGVSVTVTLK
ncbi:2-keto-4-pentenoate hydratase [Acuticoccus kandeliae]|uniref:2-keto-4-pentenoate hydratase n=1 Tax=Acuticoccus kandeliae TaxID=2073160 RepID=UPI0013007588|nr:hydratase [Acuticoccus kandeliae]